MQSSWAMRLLTGIFAVYTRSMRCSPTTYAPSQPCMRSACDAWKCSSHHCQPTCLRTLCRLQVLLTTIPAGSSRQAYRPLPDRSMEPCTPAMQPLSRLVLAIVWSMHSCELPYCQHYHTVSTKVNRHWSAVCRIVAPMTHWHWSTGGCAQYSWLLTLTCAWCRQHLAAQASIYRRTDSAAKATAALAKRSQICTSYESCDSCEFHLSNQLYMQGPLGLSGSGQLLRAAAACQTLSSAPLTVALKSRQHWWRACRSETLSRHSIWLVRCCSADMGRAVRESGMRCLASAVPICVYP